MKSLLPHFLRRPRACAYLCLATLVAFWATGPAYSQAGETQFRLDLQPVAVALGETAELSISVSGSDESRPDLLGVPGLAITYTGQSTRYQMVNGRSSSETRYHYRVTAEKVGTYELGPARQTGSAASASKTITLVVSARAAGGRTVNGSGSSEATALDLGDLAFLRVEPECTSAYVGQLIPVTIKTFFRRGLDATLESLPQLDCAAFALHDLGEEPERSLERVDGELYTVLTWAASISALKAGSHELSAAQQASVRVPRKRKPRPKRRSRSLLDQDVFGGDFFDDAFFSSFFQRSRSVDLPLKSNPQRIEVLDLPLEGRPASFRGAVGRFELTAEATPEQVSVGDPITLRALVSGEGNFDRVSQPLLASAEGWKTYPGKHKFISSDSVATRGAKIFLWNVIPQQGGERLLPPVTFSYFDPAAGRYETLESEPLRVEVSGRRQVAAAEVDPSEPLGLAPNRSSIGPRQDMSAWTGRTGPRLAAAAMGLAFLCGLGLFVRPSLVRPNGPRAQARRAAMRREAARRAMQEAARAGRPKPFFEAARELIHDHLGPAGSVTAGPIAAGPLAAALEAADGVAYGLRDHSSQGLQQWKREIESALQETESPQ